MGKLIRNYNRAVQIAIPGQPIINGVESVAALQDGQILTYKAFQPLQFVPQPGQPVPAGVVAEPYVMARVLVGNGVIIRVIIHGEDTALALMAQYPVGSKMSAWLGPITGQGRQRTINPGALLPSGFGGNDGNGYRFIELIIPGAAVASVQVQSPTTSRLEAAILRAGGSISTLPTASEASARTGAVAGGAVGGDEPIAHEEFSDRLTMALNKANQGEVESNQADEATA